VETHTFENAPIAGGTARFPLLIFSHGGGVPTFGYTSQIEELVSQGYVVAAIEHTYEDGAVGFPDGRVFPLSLNSVNFYKTLGRPETHAWEQSRDDVWAADIRFVLDQVKRLASIRARTHHFSIGSILITSECL
jgi:predicted dienelactone hydrolase